MSIFESADDYMFPTTAAGQKAAGVYEFANDENEDSDKLMEDVDGLAANARSQAMSAVLQWVEMGQFDYDTLDEIILVIADLDGDDDYTEDEEDYYNDVWSEVSNALLSLGAPRADVEEFCDGSGDDADKAGQRIGAVLTKEVKGNRMDDEDIISGFAFGEDAIIESVDEGSPMRGIFEATYRRKRVVRDGKVVIRRKRVSGRVRLNAAQKAALRKARRKANTAGAKLRRRKSMRIRRRRGL